MLRVMIFLFVGVCFCAPANGQADFAPMDPLQGRVARPQPYLINDKHQLRGRVFPADIRAIDDEPRLYDVEAAGGTAPHLRTLRDYQTQMRLIDVELAQLKRACKLSEKQQIQFETAARGAVESVVEGGVLRRAQFLAVHGSNDPVAGADQHPFWIDAVRSLLTAQQKEQLKEARRRSSEFAAEVAAQERIAAAYRATLLLDKALTLDVDQRKVFVRTLKSELVMEAHNQLELSPEGYETIRATLDEEQNVLWLDLLRSSVIKMVEKR